MNFFQLISLIVCSVFVVNCFDKEEFYIHLCRADEEYADDIFNKCDPLLKDAVAGCFEMCIIELRNARSPLIKIDPKYYQFVYCDTVLDQLFINCTIPLLGALNVPYNIMDNVAEWENCIVNTVKKLQKQIDNQGKGGKKTKPGNKNNQANNKKKVVKVVYVKRVPGK